MVGPFTIEFISALLFLPYLSIATAFFLPTLTSTSTSFTSHSPQVTPSLDVQNPQLRVRQAQKNTCTGWLIFDQPSAPYMVCTAPRTCTFGRQNGYFWQSCATPGQAITTPYTTCRDYTDDTLGDPAATQCPEARPYCGSWIWMQSGLNYTGRICTNTSSFAKFVTWTGSSTSLTNTAITTTSSRLLSSSVSSSTVPIFVSPTGARPASPTEAKSSEPQGINLVAAIAGTLGGVGSFVAGGITLYKYLHKRKSNKKTTSAS